MQEIEGNHGSNTKDPEECSSLLRIRKQSKKSQEGNQGHTSETKQFRPAKGCNMTTKTWKAGRHVQSESEEVDKTRMEEPGN